MAIINTFMAMSEIKFNRMLMLIAVVVLQHVTLLLFMVDYEKIGSIQWKSREEKLKKEVEIKGKNLPTSPQLL
ncbi:hypothetical protein HYT52_03375 [Candidatus Woesearchaeota archaeon]|nr:hypothetical protein [Candidatus Woesearchaeota archaeon]